MPRALGQWQLHRGTLHALTIANGTAVDLGHSAARGNVTFLGSMGMLAIEDPSTSPAIRLTSTHFSWIVSRDSRYG
jgi:hypothetical protein